MTVTVTHFSYPRGGQAAGVGKKRRPFSEFIYIFPLGRRGRCPHRPVGEPRILQSPHKKPVHPAGGQIHPPKNAGNFPHTSIKTIHSAGPMWASAPTTTCAGTAGFCFVLPKIPDRAENRQVQGIVEIEEPFEEVVDAGVFSALAVVAGQQRQGQRNGQL